MNNVTIQVPFEMHKNKCTNPDCGVKFSVIAVFEGKNEWGRKEVDYVFAGERIWCPYCGVKIVEGGKDYGV